MASIGKISQDEGVGSPLSTSGGLPAPRGSQLSSKISSVLSTSFADLEIRDALNTLDERGIKNDADTRRNLRLDVQKEIIQCNADVIDDFGHVAQQLKSVGAALAQLQNTCTEMRKHVSAARVETAPIIDEATTLLTQRSQVSNKQTLLAAFKEHFILTDPEITILTSTAEGQIDDTFFQTLVKAKTIQKDCDVLLGSENQRLGLDILEQSSKHLNAAFTKLYRWVQKELKAGGAVEDLESAQLSFAIRRALRVLAERPTLFQSCLDALAATREHSLSDGFYAALTGATPAASAGGRGPGDARQKPIEFSAHEPLRYVGDMLAWAHATAVSEREALEVLFIAEGDEIAKGIQSGLESEPWSRPESGEAFDGRRALGQLVDRSLAGVAQQLRQRVEQVVAMQGGTSGTDRGEDDEDATPEEPSLLYRIANLLVFYRRIFKKMLPDDNHGFTATLDALHKTSLSHFRNIMQQRLSLVRSDADNFATMPDELEPPDFLNEALDVLKSLLRSYDASSASNSTDPEAAAAELQLLYSEALDPYLNCCDAVSNSSGRKDDPDSTLDRHCFTTNCLLAAKSVLAEFPSLTPDKTTSLDAQIRDHAERLVDLQHAWLLSASGLKPLASALDSLRNKHAAEGDGGSDAESSPSEASSDDDEPRAVDAMRILAHQAFARGSLQRARTALDNFLPSALTDALERLGKQRLVNSSLAREVTSRAVARFRRDFGKVERAVVEASAKQVEMRDGKGGEEDEDDETLRDVFPRTGEEIGILLS